MRSNKLWLALLGALMATTGCADDGGDAVGSDSVGVTHHEAHDGLRPGADETFVQQTPVNLVFVGIEPGEIDEAELLSVLPSSYTPVVRYSQFYGQPGRNVGLQFDFDYEVTYAHDRFEKIFFRYLSRIGEAGPSTVFQQAYNDQATNILDVDDEILYLDGPTVEAWLDRMAPWLLGTRHDGYTVYFINWHGRDDFRFHVYRKNDQPDPDTGHSFGDDDARMMIAWGGSSSRSWFLDISAGPEAWSNNYIVDSTDIDGDGFEDGRIPPAWEYADGGYRDPALLSEDLGVVTRFVAINLLFTPSPLYDPMVTAPGAGGDKVAHAEVFEDDPTAIGADYLDIDMVRDELRKLEPYHSWSSVLDDNDPIDPGARRAFRIFAGLLFEPDCWSELGNPFFQLSCYFQQNLTSYVAEPAPQDYVAEVFALNTTDDNLGSQFGLLGFADDNQLDGTQTHVYEFNSPIYREFGYGFTTTTVHELGHHFGLSHPHDGYDSEYGFDYGPQGSLQLAWLGNEADSVMHYLATSNNFGQFNSDSMSRFHMAGYLNRANAVLADVLAAEYDDPQADWFIDRAHKRARKARRAFERWHYVEAAGHARRAYSDVLRAAVRVGVADNQANATGAPIAPGMRAHVCEVRYPGQ
jgi:hypothetical protein